jgi:hypothetical protein
VDLKAAYNGALIGQPGIQIPGATVVVFHLITTGVALAGADDPWKQWINEFTDATCNEDLEAAKLALAQIVRKAWGKNDKQATAFFRKVIAVWTENLKEIGAYFRKITGRVEEQPADEADTSAAPDGEVAEEDVAELDADELLTGLEDDPEEATPSNGGGKPTATAPGAAEPCKDEIDALV